MKIKQEGDRQESSGSTRVQFDPGRRFMLFFDQVSDETIKPVCEWILTSSFDTEETRASELTLIINSMGGDLQAAFALVDVMASSTIPIRTVGLGKVHSGGLLIFMAGKKGSRVLTPNTQILSHQWSWGAIGKQHELIATSKEFELTQARVLKHYKTHTNLSEAQIKERLLAAADQWLSAEEALELGLCDRVHNLDRFAPIAKTSKKSKKK